MSESKVGVMGSEEILSGKVRGCTCLRLRKSARQFTRHYDSCLAAAGLTIGQFGFLSGLERAQLTKPGLSLKALSGFAGMDPTTLNRSLKPLEAAGLIRNMRSPDDRRERLVSLTQAGRGKLADAIPLWEHAQATMTERVGGETVNALDRLLDLSADRLQERG